MPCTPSDPRGWQLVLKDRSTRTLDQPITIGMETEPSFLAKYIDVFIPLFGAVWIGIGGIIECMKRPESNQPTDTSAAGAQPHRSADKGRKLLGISAVLFLVAAAYYVMTVAKP